jgi:hypothetical protein
MELTLQDFIRETLVQITNGINEANKALAGTGARVNPKNMTPTSAEGAQFFGRLETGEYQHPPLVHGISFDVAVHASESSQKAGGLGIVVAAVAVGGRSKSDVAAASESRIQFDIPMLYPEAK